MKALLFILLLFSLGARAQVWNTPGFFTVPVLAPSVDTFGIEPRANTSEGITNTGWSNWNFITAGSTSTTTAWTASNIVSLPNGSSSITASVTGISTSSEASDNGTSYCTSPTDGFPAYVHRWAVFQTSISGSFTGLDNAKKYDVVIMGSRNTTGHGQDLNVSGFSSVELIPDNNCSLSQGIYTITPSSNTINWTLTLHTGISGFVYINAIYLIRHN